MSIPNNSGFGTAGIQSTVARYDPIQDSWEKLNGGLNGRRSGHSVILVENEFIVIGGINSFVTMVGGGDVPTESCKLKGQSMTCTTREPTLTQFTVYPELMLIP